MILPLAILLIQADFRKASEEVTARIESKYWIQERSQYAEEVKPSGGAGSAPAFTWDKAVYLSAAAAECRIDPKRYSALFDKILLSLSSYGCVRSGVFGYSDLPVRGDKSDRYYDDNEWIVLAELDAYDATHDSSYLLAATKLFAFVMSGESDELGGGIFWRENQRNTKNACSNAPAAFAAARLYVDTKTESYLQTAKRTYDWLGRLRDSDGLMLDHIDLAGKIERTKWTYNTALMIESGIALFKATGKRSYLDDAVKSARAAKDRWVNPESGAIKDEAAFAHHLADAFFRLSTADHSLDWRKIAENAVGAAFRETQQNGWFGSRWDRYVTRDSGLALLWQASMIRGLAMAASGDRDSREP